MKVVACLSSTVINRDGRYDVRIVPYSEVGDLSGVTHYIGHPDTRAVVEALGAEYAGKGQLFGGLEVGESFIAFPLANPDRSSGWTKDQALNDISDLRVTLVTRVE